MNDSKIKVIVDTNAIFQAVYNPQSFYVMLFSSALENKIDLISPDTVKEESYRILKPLVPDNYLSNFINDLPIQWIDKEFYSDLIQAAKKLIDHKADIPIVACALLFNCGILTLDSDFDNKRLKKEIKLWKIADLLKEINK